MKQIVSSKVIVISAITIAVFVLLALLAPLLCSINGTDPYTYNIDALDGSGVPLEGWTAEHWFGVEPLTGRDLFAIVAFGAQTSLTVGVCATAFVVFIGTIMGLIAGFCGGIIDTLLSRFNDFMLAFPSLIFMISIRSIVPDWFPPMVFMILIIGLFSWPGIARVVRSETLRMRSQEFVIAAITAGATPKRIIFAHILPNLTKTVIIFATMNIPGMIGYEAALSYLGIGLPPPTPSWGRSISDAVNWIQVDPLYLLIPGMALFIITLAFNYLGDGLRDVFDPKMLHGRQGATA